MSFSGMHVLPVSPLGTFFFEAIWKLTSSNTDEVRLMNEGCNTSRNCSDNIGNDLPSDVQLNQSTNVYRELRPHNEQYHFQSHWKKKKLHAIIHFWCKKILNDIYLTFILALKVRKPLTPQGKPQREGWSTIYPPTTTPPRSHPSPSQTRITYLQSIARNGKTKQEKIEETTGTLPADGPQGRSHTTHNRTAGQQGQRRWPYLILNESVCPVLSVSQLEWVYLSLSVRVSVWMSLFVPSCLCASLYESICPFHSVCQFVWVYLSLLVRVSVCMSLFVLSYPLPCECAWQMLPAPCPCDLLPPYVDFICYPIHGNPFLCPFVCVGSGVQSIGYLPGTNFRI